jgi:SAM-dependent methyltransferase
MGPPDVKSGYAETPLPLKRYPTGTAELRARELQWWARYADAEERYFWGLAGSWQPLARARYLDAMARALVDARHVVEYGCGNGWVARAIADRIRRPVTGLDFSPAQIELANASNRDCPWTLFLSIEGPRDLPSTDGYVFHGVLHHMAEDEIHQLLGRVAARAPRGARVILAEPVIYPGQHADDGARALYDEIQAMTGEPRRAAERAGFAESPQVAAARRAAGERCWGEPPHGPSPMEKPFEGDEFTRLVAHYFVIEDARIVQYLPASQTIASELALVASYAPEPMAALASCLLREVDALERALLRMPRKPDGGWYLQMICARVS